LSQEEHPDTAKHAIITRLYSLIQEKAPKSLATFREDPSNYFRNYIGKSEHAEWDEYIATPGPSDASKDTLVVYDLVKSRLRDARKASQKLLELSP